MAVASVPNWHITASQVLVALLLFLEFELLLFQWHIPSSSRGTDEYRELKRWKLMLCNSLIPPVVYTTDTLWV